MVPIDAFASEDKLEKDGSKRSRRLKPVFRDRDELSVSGSLADAIRVALESSENLIVLCSPDSAKSQYVNSEIELFRSLHPDNEKKIYALIIEGEPPACFPPALTAGDAEPIAADAREAGDGKADAKLKLIAGILGVGFDRLKRREEKRQRNRLLTMVSVVSAVAVMTTALAMWALRAERKASLAEQNSRIQEKASRARVLAATEPVKALALALDTAEEERLLKGEVSPPVLSSLLHTLESGREIARYYSAAVRNAVADCALSPDGSLIAYTAGSAVYVVDRNSGLSSKVLSAPDGVSARRVVFDPKGERMVVGDDEGTVSVLSTSNQKILWQHKAHKGAVRGLAWLASTGQIVSCGGDGVLRFWRASGKQAAPDIPFPGNSIGAFAISPDGKVAAVAAAELSAGDGVRLINCETGKITELDVGDDLLRALAFNQSGSRLAGAGLDRVVRFWNIKGQRLGGTIRTGHEESINSLAFHPFEPLVITGSGDGTLRGYTESGKQVFTPLRGHTKTVWSVGFDRVGTNLVSAGEDGSVRIWDLPGLQAVAPIETGINCRALLFHPDGSRFAAGGMDGKIRLYAYPSGKLLRTIAAHSGSCDALVDLADGSGFASEASRANEVRVFSWQGDTGGEVFRDSGGGIAGIAVHPSDSVLFVLGHSGELYQLALPSLEVLRKTSFLDSSEMKVMRAGFAVLPENNSLLLRGSDFIDLWSIGGQKKLLARDGDLQNAVDHRFHLALSSDRKLVLTGGHHTLGGSQLKLYHLPQLESAMEVEVPWKIVPVAAFSHSGRELALVSEGGMLQFFSVKGEAEGPELRVHGHTPRGFAMHPTDDVLATAGGDGWIRFWRFGQEAWMEAARVRLGRAKAQDLRAQSFLARTASRMLSHNPGDVERGSDGKLSFPEAGISMKIPGGWAQFDPRALALLEGLMTAVGSDRMKRVKLRGAFSKGDQVQFRLVGAPNFYLTTIDEFHDVESFAEQLPVLQSELERLLKARAQTIGFASGITFAKPTWDNETRAFLLEAGGKGADGNLIRIKIWMVPTKSHFVAIVFSGDANLAREVEAIVQTIEIDSAIAPSEEEYARAGEVLEAATTVFYQRHDRLKEMNLDHARNYDLIKRGNTEKAGGKLDKALANYEKALVLARKWTKGNEGSPSQKTDKTLKVSASSFSILEIQTLHKIAWLHNHSKDADRAAAAAGEAAALLEKLRQPLKNHSRVLFHNLEANCFLDMCRALALQKDYKGAAVWMGKSVDACRKSTEADPLKEAGYLMKLADFLKVLSEMQRGAKDYDAAISSAEEAIEVAENIAVPVRSSDWPMVLSGYYRVLAENFRVAGKGAEQIAAAESALRLAEDARNAYPNESSYRWAIAAERYGLMNAIRHHAPERLEEAITLLREVVDEIAVIRAAAGEVKVAGNDTRQVESDRRRLLATLYGDRATQLQTNGGPQEEELGFLDQAVVETEEALRLSPGMTADYSLQIAYDKRGAYYLRMQRYAESMADQAKQVMVLRRMVSRENNDGRKLELAGVLNSYTSVLVKEGEINAATTANGESIEILKGLIAANPEDLKVKGLLIGVMGTAIEISIRSGDTDLNEELRSRRLVLAEELIENPKVEVAALIQVYYAFSGTASYREINKIGKAEDWIALYEKAFRASAKFEKSAKLTSGWRKHHDRTLSALEKLRASNK